MLKGNQVMCMYIINKFKEQVESNPTKIAVTSKARNYTFKEIKNIAVQIAQELDRKQGSKIVAYYLNDTCFVLPTVLGIWLSGRIPMPLVSALKLPEAVKRVEDVEFDTLLVDFAVETEQEIIKVNDFDSKEDCTYQNIESSQFENNDTVYILSTSGSTGIPKKVFLAEKNINWIVDTLYPLIDINQNSSFLFSTPYSFDVSISEILAPAVTGCTLVCLEKGYSIREVPAVLSKQKITHLSLSPSFADALLDITDNQCFLQLKCVMIAGENFPISLANKLKTTLSNGCRVFNLYGPTETTLYATCHELTGNEQEFVPIGKALDGAVAKIFDKDRLKEVEKGELYIGGKGLTQGYLLDPVKNNESFITIAGHKYYSTGDNVFRNQDNELVFLNRQDDQIEVNGIRIELGEIQAIASSIESIKSAVVKYFKGKIYIFYISSNNQEEVILSKLPDYIKPIILKVDHFSYTYNRKFATEKMINEYYTLNSDGNKDNDIKAKVDSILNKYHVNRVSDLDSLDLVRLLLDLEHTFNIKINEAQASMLVTSNDVINLVIAARNETNKKTTTPTSNLKADLINLANMMKNLSFTYDDEQIKASSSQQSLFRQHKKSIIYTSFKLKEVTAKEVDKIKQLFCKLAEKIDILKFAWFFKDDSLFFKKIKEAHPLIYIAQENINDNELAQIMYSDVGKPVYLVLINEQTSELRLIFSHHVIDAASLRLIEHVFVNVYENNFDIKKLPDSSFAIFMQYIEKTNKNNDLQKLLLKLPDTSTDLNLTKDDNVLHIIKFKHKVTSADDAYIIAMFLIGKVIAQEKAIDTVTGELSLNIRKFAGFDASNIIGDLHSTVPFLIKKDDSITTFTKRYHNWKTFYQTGTDIRYSIFNHIGQNMTFLPKLTSKWRKLNLAPNYIGETKSLDEEIKEIKSLPFKPNYITLTSSQGYVYAISYGKLLQKEKYEVTVADKKIRLINTVLK